MSEPFEFRDIDIINTAGVRAVAPGTRALTTSDYWQVGDEVQRSQEAVNGYARIKKGSKLVGALIDPPWIPYMPTGSVVREFDRLVVERTVPVSATNIVSLLRDISDMRPLVPGRDAWQRGDRYWQRATKNNGLDGWWNVVGSDRGKNDNVWPAADRICPGAVISLAMTECFPYGYKVREMMPANLNSPLSGSLASSGIITSSTISAWRINDALMACQIVGTNITGITTTAAQLGIPPSSGIISAFGAVRPNRGSAPGAMFTDSKTMQSYVWTGTMWVLVVAPAMSNANDLGDVPTTPIPPVAPAPTETRRKFSL